MPPSALRAGVAVMGCAIEKISPPGVVKSRAVAVHPRDVRLFTALADVPVRHSVVEDVFIKDDGDLSPREMESRLRVQAGARGTNAIVLDSRNRRDNGTGST